MSSDAHWPCVNVTSYVIYFHSFSLLLFYFPLTSRRTTENCAVSWVTTQWNCSTRYVMVMNWTSCWMKHTERRLVTWGRWHDSKWLYATRKNWWEKYITICAQNPVSASSSSSSSSVLFFFLLFFFFTQAQTWKKQIVFFYTYDSSPFSSLPWVLRKVLDFVCGPAHVVNANTPSLH